MEVGNVKEFMAQATSVRDWNQRRAKVKREYKGSTAQMFDEMSRVDQSGLIVETLGKDYMYQQASPSNHEHDVD